jgi:hypothetical protein
MGSCAYDSNGVVYILCVDSDNVSGIVANVAMTSILLV